MLEIKLKSFILDLSKSSELTFFNDPILERSNFSPMISNSVLINNLKFFNFDNDLASSLEIS